ncbi:ribosomal large subunit pseudouridine synthase D [Desulfuromusa kysingii]|uniref:Pseudouridine synthase n=1 Tax=Desulfuromusa kysingii TaxID=37625 RepID=A0A1H3W9S3_9BACT|nr:RluA family pseudouridine synthase [Desulfuromusa kysingii]SDZ83601.1 ribosomal large subunit pseudouridine synthase D [Desulfuromusa kysingii]
MEESQQLLFSEDRPAERLDTFLSECFPNISRSQLKKLIDNGQITLNGSPTKSSNKLRGGESIQVVFSEPEPVTACPENIPLHILYEDQDVIVINKPAGMVVHPAAGHFNGTLVNALLYHCQDLAGIGGELRPGIVHRIDKDTSGVIIATKNDLSHHHLAAQFKDHSINRRYLALVHGFPVQPSGTIDHPIGRHPTQRKKMSGKSKNGKRAVTHWKTIKQYNNSKLTLIELKLETGRTHQIRVHFSEINCPLVGDPLYGNKSRTTAIKDGHLRQLISQLPGQALHAQKLGFIHPRSEKYMEFSSEMPETLSNIITYLDNIFL